MVTHGHIQRNLLLWSHMGIFPVVYHYYHTLAYSEESRGNYHKGHIQDNLPLWPHMGLFRGIYHYGHTWAKSKQLPLWPYMGIFRGIQRKLQYHQGRIQENLPLGSYMGIFRGKHYSGHTWAYLEFSTMRIFRIYNHSLALEYLKKKIAYEGSSSPTQTTQRHYSSSQVYRISHTPSCLLFPSLQHTFRNLKKNRQMEIARSSSARKKRTLESFLQQKCLAIFFLETFWRSFTCKRLCSSQAGCLF